MRAWRGGTGFGLLMLVAAARAAGPAPSLVVDIHAQPGSEASASPTSFVAAAGLAFFVADDGVHGREVWRTDGSAAGTFMVADLLPGPGSSDPKELTSLGDALIFTAFDECGTAWAWMTDGTRTGAQRVTDAIYALGYPASAASNWSRASYVRWGDDIAFWGRDAATGVAPWITDGTPSGTRRLPGVPLELHAGATGYLVASGGVLFFSQGLLSPGLGLWAIREPGSAAVQLLAAGTTGTGVGVMGAFEGRIAFAFDDGASGGEPWVSDGTVAGTQPLLGDLNPGPAGSAMYLLGAAGDRFLFRAQSSAGHLVYATDGSPGGTMPLPAEAGGATMVASARSLGASGGRQWLIASTSGGSGSFTQVVISDGTPAGTTIAADLRPPGSHSQYFIAGAVMGDRALVVDGGGNLCLADAQGLHAAGKPAGGVAGASMVPVASSSPSWVFSSDWGADGGREPWRADGTPAGIARILDVNPAWPTVGSEPSPPAPVGDGVVFFATSEAQRRTAHVSDGTPGGTASLGVATSTWSSWEPLDPVASNGDRACYIARTEPTSRGFWCTDGTGSGTREIVHLESSGAASDDPAAFALGEGFVVFRALASGLEAFALGREDNALIPLASLGTYRKLHPWARPVVAGGRLVAVVEHDAPHPQRAYEKEIWTTDGTPSGTRRLVAWPGALPNGRAAGLNVLVSRGSDAMVFFEDEARGLEPWIIDPVLGTVSPAAECVAGPGGAGPEAWTVASGTLMFSAWIETAAEHVVATDGTPAGTRALVNLADSGQMMARAFREADGVAYFLTTPGSQTDWSLWRSNGTPGGTVMVLPHLTDRAELWAMGDRIVFTRKDAAGREPWITDGTPEGTGRLEDTHAGTGSSDASAFVATASHVYFVATDGVTGRELHAFPRRVLWDADLDGVPDAADSCRFGFDPLQGDLDGDGVADACDGCSVAADPGQEDGDCDGVADACAFAWGDLVPRDARDGRLDIRDAVWILRASVGLETLGPADMLVADIAPALEVAPGPPARVRPAPGTSHRVDVADVVLALRAAVGLVALDAPR